MVLWKIFVGMLCVLATLCGAFADYDYTFDTDINGITPIYLGVGYGSGAGIINWSAINGGSLVLFHDGTADYNRGFLEQNEFFGVGQTLEVWVTDDYDYGSPQLALIGLHFLFCNQTIAFDGDVQSNPNCTVDSTFISTQHGFTQCTPDDGWSSGFYNYITCYDSVQGHQYHARITRLTSTLYNYFSEEVTLNATYELNFSLNGEYHVGMFARSAGGTGGGWNVSVQRFSLSSCVEDWSAVLANASCNASDLLPELKVYEDLNLCGTSISLPVDNGSINNVYACNYCSEDISQHLTAWSACVMPEALQYRTAYFVDSNYASCCQTTLIPADCHVNNGSYVNSSQSQGCYERYDEADVKNILVDGLGTAAASIVKFADLIITVLIIAGIVGMGAVAVARLKK